MGAFGRSSSIDFVPNFIAESGVSETLLPKRVYTQRVYGSEKRDCFFSAQLFQPGITQRVRYLKVSFRMNGIKSTSNGVVPKSCHTPRGRPRFKLAQEITPGWSVSRDDPRAISILRHMWAVCLIEPGVLRILPHLVTVPTSTASSTPLVETSARCQGVTSGDTTIWIGALKALSLESYNATRLCLVPRLAARGRRTCALSIAPGGRVVFLTAKQTDT